MFGPGVEVEEQLNRNGSERTHSEKLQKGKPMLGMFFYDDKEVYIFNSNYARKEVFNITRRSSNNGEI